MLTVDGEPISFKLLDLEAFCVSKSPGPMRRPFFFFKECEVKDVWAGSCKDQRGGGSREVGKGLEGVTRCSSGEESLELEQQLGDELKSNVGISDCPRLYCVLRSPRGQRKRD